jgi:UDP-glucose 4-epimerase
MTIDPMTTLYGRRVLVTGGAGFVGGALAHRLVELGAEVVVLDDLFTGQRSVVPAEAKFVLGAVEDAELVESLVGRADVVFHLAARNIIASTEEPRRDFEANVGGTLNVLLAARKVGIDRLVYSGSASIYGNPSSIPINEEDFVLPLTPYAASKLSAEHYCQVFYEGYGVPTSIVRYSNIFGIGQRPDNPYCGVVSKFFVAAHEGRPLRVHGDGEQTRDYTYISDAVEATLLAAVQPRALGEVFNVGTGVETSVNQLARIIGEVVERAITVEHVDRRDIDNIRRRVVNNERARRLLRWSPQVSLRDGLALTAHWLEHVPV